MEMTGEKDFKKDWISDVLLVAGCTAVSYLYTVQFESGFLRYYGIPSEILEISMTTVLYVTCTLITLAFSAFGFLLGFSWPMSKNSFLIPRIAAVLPMIAMALVNLWAYEDWKRWIFSVIMAIILLLAFFIFPLFHGHKGKYKDKLAAQQEIDRRGLERRVPDLLLGWIGPKTYYLAFWMIIGFFLCSPLGEGTALRKNSYTIINTSPEALVVRVYNDKAVCVPFSRAEKQLQKGFFFVKLTEDRKWFLASETIGPLKQADKVYPATSTRTK